MVCTRAFTVVQIVYGTSRVNGGSIAKSRIYRTPMYTYKEPSIYKDTYRNTYSSRAARVTRSNNRHLLWHYRRRRSDDE